MKASFFIGSILLLLQIETVSDTHAQQLAFVGDPQEETLEERRARIEQFIYEGPLFLQDNSVTAIRNLGEKNELVETDIHSDDPSQYGHIQGSKIWKWDGLEIIGFEFEESYGRILDPSEVISKKVRPELITITSPRWKLLNGLEVEMSADRVIEVLGQPQRREGDALIFGGDPSEVTFYINENKITKIIFWYYGPD